MARMSKFLEVKDYVRAWREAKPEAESFRRYMERVAQEQRRNYESCFGDGRSPTWCDREEYRKCVEYLEDTAKARP